jgi:hypothetical protein
MAEDLSTSGAPNEAAGGNHGTTKDVVSYDTYRKAIGEVKKLKEVLDTVAREKEEQQNSAMIEQNRFKELAEAKIKENEELKRKFQHTQKSFVEQNLKQVVARYAKDMGAIEGAVDQIYSVGDWSSVDLGEDFSVNADKVKELVGELSKKSPWFFKKTPAGIKDVSMGSNGINTSGADLSKLTTEELIKLGKTL